MPPHHVEEEAASYEYLTPPTSHVCCPFLSPSCPFLSSPPHLRSRLLRSFLLLLLLLSRKALLCFSLPGSVLVVAFP